MAKQVSSTHHESGKTPAPSNGARPWPSLLSLRDEVDHLFEDFMGSWPLAGRLGERPFGMSATLPSKLPATDIVENDKEIRMTVEMPGMEEKDIDVSVDEGRLTVKGEKTEERKEEKDDYRLSERHYGSFQRSFQLPPSVDAEKIDARYKSGVLTLTLPKTEAAQKKQRKISIKSA